MARKQPSVIRAVIEVEGSSQAEAFIRAIGDRAFNTQPLMDELVGVLQHQQQRRVEGHPFAPLTEETVERKEREGENPELFRDEQRRIRNTPTRVRDSMYLALTAGSHPGQLRYATRTMATWGLRSAGREQFFYARFVQNVKGTRRRILAINEDDALVLVGWIEKYVMGNTELTSKAFKGSGERTMAGSMLGSEAFPIPGGG